MRIKKHYLLLISLLVLFSFNTQAQENEITKTNKHGFEFFISGNHTLEKEGRLGIGGGINFVINKDKPLNFLIGIDYNYREQQIHAPFSGGYYVYSGNFMTYNSFISIPTLSVRYNIGKKTKLFFELGLYADMLLNREARYLDYDFDVNAVFGESSFGGVLAVGVKVPINKYSIFIKTDYKLGLSSPKEYLNNYQYNYYRLIIGFAI